MSSHGEQGSDAVEVDIRSFDERLTRLEDVVANLEQGGIALEESLRLFEEGMGLLRGLTRVLEVVETRIEELVDNGSKGTVTGTFDVAE